MQFNTVPTTGTLRRLVPLLLPEAALPEAADPIRGRSAGTAGLMGYDLGWDYARYGVPLPGDLSLEVPYLGQGYKEGREHWRGRTRVADVFVRKWLRMRGSAFRRGRVIHESVTPDLLRAIAMDCCPVTREALSYPTVGTDHKPDPRVLWSIDRLSNDAGYIAGNLVVMSELANKAKGSMSFPQIYSNAVRLLKTGQALGGLDGLQWTRLACLTACHLPTEQWRALQALPMVCLLPPMVVATNRLIVLQGYLSRLPQMCGWTSGAKAWSACFERPRLAKLASSVATDFYQAVKAEVMKHPRNRSSWQIEDAWMNPALIQSWGKFCAQLTDADLASAKVPRELSTRSAEAWGRDSGMQTRGYAN